SRRAPARRSRARAWSSRSLDALALAYRRVGAARARLEHLFLAALGRGVLVVHLRIGQHLAPDLLAVVGPDRGALEVPLAIAGEQAEAEAGEQTDDREDAQHALSVIDSRRCDRPVCSSCSRLPC